MQLSVQLHATEYELWYLLKRDWVILSCSEGFREGEVPQQCWDFSVILPHA
jgi:hypothetical protein